MSIAGARSGTKREKIKCHNKKQKKGDFVRKSGCIGVKHVLLNAMKLESLDSEDEG